MTRRWKTITTSPLFKVILLSLFLSGMGCFVLWDYSRVDRDFRHLKALLQDTRNLTIGKNETLIARFVYNQVIVTDRKTGNAVKNLDVPTLAEVNYDTTLGNDMIIFDGHGTSSHNKRVHGGDLRLKSWLGFRKNIALNCTGLVSEGVYPPE